MDNIDDLVDEVSRNLPSTKVRELAQGYSYQGRDRTKDIGLKYQEQGYLNLDQASELVDWKTAKRQTTNFLEGNKDVSVKRLTKIAAQAAKQHRDSPEVAACILNALYAVQFPTASTILTAWNPKDFGIIDRRSWSALRNLTDDSVFNRPKGQAFTPCQFRLYTLLLRRWGTRVCLSPREIDKALWQYDKETG